MDEFLRTAQDDWRNQPLDIAEMRGRLRRHRWTPHLMLTFEILGGVGGFAVGLWFVWLGLSGGGMIYMLAAAVMLAAMPLSTVFSIIARRGALRWEEETPDGILRSSLARAEASLRAIRVGYLGTAIIGGFVVMLWVAQASGLIHAMDFMSIYSLAAAITCLPYLLYLSWRRQRICQEREACRQLLHTLAIDE